MLIETYASDQNYLSIFVQLSLPNFLSPYLPIPSSLSSILSPSLSSSCTILVHHITSHPIFCKLSSGAVVRIMLHASMNSEIGEAQKHSLSVSITHIHEQLRAPTQSKYGCSFLYTFETTVECTMSYNTTLLHIF